MTVSAKGAYDHRLWHGAPGTDSNVGDAAFRAVRTAALSRTSNQAISRFILGGVVPGGLVVAAAMAVPNLAPDSDAPGSFTPSTSEVPAPAVQAASLRQPANLRAANTAPVAAVVASTTLPEAVTTELSAPTDRATITTSPAAIAVSEPTFIAEPAAPPGATTGVHASSGLADRIAPLIEPESALIVQPAPPVLAEAPSGAGFAAIETPPVVVPTANFSAAAIADDIVRSAVADTAITLSEPAHSFQPAPAPAPQQQNFTRGQTGSFAVLARPDTRLPPAEEPASPDAALSLAVTEPIARSGDGAAADLVRQSVLEGGITTPPPALPPAAALPVGPAPLVQATVPAAAVAAPAALVAPPTPASARPGIAESGPLTPSADFSPVVPAPRYGAATTGLDIQTRLTTRIDGKLAGAVDILQTESALMLRLGSIAELLGDRFSGAELRRITTASASETYLTLAQLQAQGIPISYDPVYDEFNIGLADTRPKNANKVFIEQIGTPERGRTAPGIDQVRR
jgi:hypothetical protein